MKLLFSFILVVGLASTLSALAAHQVIEADSPLVIKSGPGFTNMFIKYGRVGMGSGDQIVTTCGTNAVLEYTIPAGNRSVSVMFLFHNQGQIAETYIDHQKCVTIDTFARSSVAQRMGGVAGQIREVLVASDLDPAKTHKLKIVNTARSSSDSNYLPREMNQGPQLAVDAIRIGDYEFGSLSGTVRDDMGRPMGDARLTLTSLGGRVKDPSRAIIYSDGFGRYSSSGLRRGRDYQLELTERVGSYSGEINVPVDSTAVVQDITVKYMHLSRPRITVPAFVLKGGSLAIEVEARDGITGWNARLKNAYKAIPLRVDSAAFGSSNVLGGARSGWLLKATVPAGAPEDIWDLEVTSSYGTRIEPRCVKVLANYDRSFYVAQVTDVHCFGDPQTRNDFRFTQTLSTLDAVGARFIAVTGDLCHFKGIRQVFDSFNEALMSCSNTPTCVIPGNHDTLLVDRLRGVTQEDASYNHDLYERHIGQSRYDLRMGNIYVVADNIFSGDEDWARRRFAGCTTADQIRVFLSHYHTLDFQQPPYPTIHLFGHNHINQRIFKGPTNSTYPAISIVSVNDSGSRKHANEFRLVRFNRDENQRWALGTYTYNSSASLGVPFAEAMGGPITSFNLTRTYLGPNDGTQSSNTVSFVNKTLERFEMANARFVLTKGTYTVSGGKILETYSSDDQTKSIVLVEFDAVPNATTSVKIRPASSETVGTPPKVGSPIPASVVVTRK